MDTGPVYRTVCLFTPLFTPVPNILLGDRGSVREQFARGRTQPYTEAGIEPAISNRKSVTDRSLWLLRELGTNCRHHFVEFKRQLKTFIFAQAFQLF